MGPSEPLRGKRFLIVEDEPLIALEIVAGLESAGADVEGPIGSVEDALRAIEDASFDGVLLDANLWGKSAGDIAAALTRRNIPFVFVTGYGRQALPESFGQSTMLTKPLYPRATTPNGSTARQTDAAWPSPAQGSPCTDSFTTALFAHFTALALHKSLVLPGAVHSEMAKIIRGIGAGDA